MTPTEKQYVEKLKEYNTYLIKALRLNKIMWDITIGPRGNYELQIAKIEQQVAEEEKTVYDKSLIGSTTDFIIRNKTVSDEEIEDKSISIDQYMNMNPEIDPHER